MVEPPAATLSGDEGQTAQRLHHSGRLCLPREETRSEEHTSELQSLRHLVCRLLLEKKDGLVEMFGGNADEPLKRIRRDGWSSVSRGGQASPRNSRCCMVCAMAWLIFFFFISLAHPRSSPFFPTAPFFQ